ncbi:MAG: hypothetical protein P8P80_04990 [Crocinitomicaceae bacterium]|nr:hypothetical protein [Crocinitomicaceae bacterium]MDG1735659.1 hypothetical protein [Crocinitomicaceae bacterium]MDG2505967.1 hypothetical protein [Crocinitomicaceae bacterium]
METVLFFGVGWLGSPVVDSLRQSHRKLIIATRKPDTKILIPDTVYTQIEIDAETGILSFVENIPEVDKILIMLPPSGLSNYEKTIHSIVVLFPNCKQVVFTSSTGVYLNQLGVLNEESSVIKDHPVFLAEQVVKTAYPKSYQILRLAGLVGNNRHPVKFLISKPEVKNGLAPVNLIHRKDIIQAILLVLEGTQNVGIYNLCYPNHPQKANYYNVMAKKLYNKTIEFENGSGGKEIDGSKFATEFEFEYQYDINEINNFDALI